MEIYTVYATGIQCSVIVKWVLICKCMLCFMRCIFTVTTIFSDSAYFQVKHTCCKCAGILFGLTEDLCYCHRLLSYEKDHWVEIGPSSSGFTSVHFKFRPITAEPQIFLTFRMRRIYFVFTVLLLASFKHLLGIIRMELDWISSTFAPDMES